MGKGSRPRASQITRAERELRQEFSEGMFSLAIFNRKFAKLKRLGLIRRSGRVLK